MLAVMARVSNSLQQTCVESTHFTAPAPVTDFSARERTRVESLRRAILVWDRTSNRGKAMCVDSTHTGEAFTNPPRRRIPCSYF
jgi:hypothetical protein